MPERGDRIWPQIKLWIRGEHERKSCISLNSYYVIVHDRVSSPVHCCRRCRLARAFLSEKHDDLPVQNNRAAVKNQESPLVKYHGQGWSQDQGAKCSLIDPWSRRDSNVATSHNSKSRDPFPTKVHTIRKRLEEISGGVRWCGMRIQYAEPNDHVRTGRAAFQPGQRQLGVDFQTVCEIGEHRSASAWGDD